jgi:hypothetical protein
MMNAGSNEMGASQSKPKLGNDDPKAADDYEVAIDREKGLMRIIHRNGAGILSYQVLPSDDAYNLAQKILKGYDQLEGI